MEKELNNRLFNFSISIIKAVRNLPKSTEFRIISRQLVKSATSVGANYEEAQAGVSRADFSNKIGISLKEIRESNYWIRIIVAIEADNLIWKKLAKESEELMKILGSIYFKTSQKR